MEHPRPSCREHFHVAIVCALALEFDAAWSQLDEVWDNEPGGSAFGKLPGDTNIYVNGRIRQHNVVLVLLSNGMGKVNAAHVTNNLRFSYPNVRITLLVGICGGVPKSEDDEILLGDVVISSSLVQYDFGRQYPDGFRRKGSLNKLNPEILGILGMLKTNHKDLTRKRAVSSLRELQQREPKYAFPRAAQDKLFQPKYRHKHQGSPDCECRDHGNELDPVCEKAIESTCEEVGCEDGFLVQRSRLEQRVENADGTAFDPAIHVGAVASGDTVMKSATRRDKIAEKEGIIAFEMEAAGIWEHQPCLVIKGVCDYADSHKNKKFQDYTAATAASVAKALLMLYTPAEKTGPTAIKLFAPKWTVQFPQDPDFVDQAEISTWLKDMFNLPGVRVALLGLGGIGKSQLAIQFAYAVRDKSHVFWVNATTRSTLEESYRSIAQKLGLEPPDDSLKSINRCVSDWLSDERNGRWTVVLDNFDDSSVLTDDDPRLTKILPETSNGFTLVTSRTLMAAEKLVGNSKHIYHVTAMREEVAMELFQSKLKEPCGKGEAQEVVRLLGNIPLAISQAAAFINRPNSQASVGGYAEKLRSTDTQNKLLEWEHDDGRRYQGASTSVLGTWTVTFNQIQRERSSAAHLLSLMSFFSPQSIPGWALKNWYESDPSELPCFTNRDVLPSYASDVLSFVSAGRNYLNRPLKADEKTHQPWGRWAGTDLDRGGNLPTQSKKPRFSSISRALKSDWWSSKSGSRSVGDTASTSAVGPGEEFERDLETLLGYSLVMPTASEGVFKMHPLVRDCTQTWISRSGNIGEWKKRFLVAAYVNIDAFKDRNRLQQGLGIHFDPLAEEPEDAPTARLWFGLAWSIHWTWQETGIDSTPLANKMIAVGERLLGPADRFTLTSMDLKARSLVAGREYGTAEAVYKDLLQRAETANQQNSYVMQESRLAYARMLTYIGRLDDSERLARGIVEDRMRVLGPKNDDTLWSLGNHASALTKMGRFEEACGIVKGLLQEDWTDREEFVHEVTMNCIAGIALSMSSHDPAKEVEPLLREMADFVERDPKTCTWFPYVIQGPFHLALSQCLEKQGKKYEATKAGNIGIELMANVIPMPSLQPPTLLASLLDEMDENGERRETLLQSVIENLRSENATLDYAFCWGMVNIGRRLSMQDRDDEALQLLDAICNHLDGHSAYGSAHKVTTLARLFSRHFKDTWSEKRRNARREESRSQSMSTCMDSNAETLRDLTLN